MAATVHMSNKVRCWSAFFSADGAAEFGQEFDRDDPLVVNHPEFFVDSAIPRRDWPSAYDRVIEEAKQRALAEETDRRERFEKAGRANPVTITTTLYRATADFFATVDSQPALVKRGSTVSEGNPLLAEHFEHFAKVKS